MLLILDGKMRCSSAFVGSCRGTWHDRKHQLVIYRRPELHVLSCSYRLEPAWDVIIAQQNHLNDTTRTVGQV